MAFVYREKTANRTTEVSHMTQPSRQLKLGTDIRAARTDQHLSLRQLSRLCGVSASKICRIELGDDCTVSDLDAICTALGLIAYFGSMPETSELYILDTTTNRLLAALKEGDYPTALRQFVAIGEAWKPVRERQDAAP